MSETIGAIEKHDPVPKEMRPNKDGSKSFKYGVQVGGNWYGVFGSEAEIRSIESDILNIESHEEKAQAKITWDFSKDGKYRNISEIVISDGGGAHTEKTPKKTAAELAQEKALKDADVNKSLSGATVKEEVLGVEDQEAEENEHYTKAWIRANLILKRTLAKESRLFISVEEQTAFKLAVFERLASPLVYLRENIRRARVEAGVK